MDFHLRCNNLRCRERLTEQAVVTTCSHIFCLDCSESPQLSPPEGHARVCPACKSQLDDPDAAVMTNLRPSDEYKTSVLSGLSPAIIMECASRGTAFYEYQCTQEIHYQEHKCKSMSKKQQDAQSELNALAAQSADSIANLQHELQEAHNKINNMKRDIAELSQAKRQAEKERETIKQSWTRLKQAEINGELEQAAEDDALLFLREDEPSQYTTGNARAGGQFLHSRAGSNGSAGRKQIRELYGLQHGGRNNLHSSRSCPVPMTPSGHRQRLALQSAYANRTSHLPRGYGGITVDQLQHGTPYRQPLANIDPNNHLGPSGSSYGLSAGVKVGRQPSGQMGRPGMNNGRPRAGVGLTMR